MIHLLALSGSLRKSSYNTAVLQAMAALAPDGIGIQIGSIADLPLFNPDLEDQPIPALELLRSQLQQADGLIIASPEYAHGVSGPLKNALDWLVSGTEFPYKPVMLVNTSPRASHALASLREIIATMSGQIVEPACITVPLLGSGLDAHGIVENQAMVGILVGAVKTFGVVCRER